MPTFRRGLRALALVLSACGAEEPKAPEGPGHCVSHQGNRWCSEQHGAPLYCHRGLSECDPIGSDGCSADAPSTPECYSPCGGLSLAQNPSITCEGYEGATTTSSITETTAESTSTTGTSSEAGTTSEMTSESSESSGESSSTGPVGCLGHEDCISASEPACGPAGLCVACEDVEDGDAACAAYSHDTPLCRLGECVPCDGETADACPEETPACADHQCVECSADDTTACPAEAPACGDENRCVACTPEDLGACADNASAPACFENACVACTAEDRGACEGTTPVCDVETNTCVPCTEHSQCESGVCRADDTGECIPLVFVLVVDGAAQNCGTQNGPLCDVADAINLIPEGPLMALLIHAIDSNYVYFVNNWAVEGDRSVMMVAAEGETPIIQGTSGPGLTVSGGATVWLDGIHLVQGTGQALLVTGEGSRAELKDCRVANNTGGGISVTDGGTVELDRCHVVENRRGPGISSSLGSVDVVNSFVQGPVDGVALSITSSTASVVYSTVGGHLGSADALRCNEGSTVSVRNSLLLSRGNPNAVDCPDATIEYSGITGAFSGTGNLENIEVSLDWVPGYNNGDFHLTDGHPADGIALWQEGDPMADIDGDWRNVSESVMGVAGADVP